MCNHIRTALVSAKCSDMFSAYFKGVESPDYFGYVPSCLGVGEGDYVEFEYCLDCGQIMGKFPVEVPSES